MNVTGLAVSRWSWFITYGPPIDGSSCQLIGWVTIMRAVLTLLWPRCVSAIGRRHIQSRPVFTAIAAIGLALGLASATRTVDGG